MSTEARPIEVVGTASRNIIRADEIGIETAKTGKVTAVVMVISIFCRRKCKSRSANPGNIKPSCQKAESANLIQEKSCKPRKPFSEKEKRLDFEEISA